MTIKELFLWALKNEVEEAELEIYDCDGGIFLNETHAILEEPEIYSYQDGYKVVRL